MVLLYHFTDKWYKPLISLVIEMHYKKAAMRRIIFLSIGSSILVLKLYLYVTNGKELESNTRRGGQTLSTLVKVGLFMLID